MLLHRLISELDPNYNLNKVPSVDITGICEDSRFVKPGDLFVARSGTKNEGAKFIGDAIARGALAVAASEVSAECPVPQIVIPDPGESASALANIFYRRPSMEVNLVGVTGTNGKTTTTYLLRHLLGKFNQRCGMIGTVETDDGKVCRESSLTTPGAIEVVKLLASMRDNGCKACAMEVSSHALDQGRVAGVRFAGAAFTNLTRDHLDYHKDMDRYAEAKAKLFEMLDEDAVAVVNGDDAWSERMLAKCRARPIRFGFGDNADYRARDFALTSEGCRFVLHTPDGNAPVAMGMIGQHNIANALTAAALAGEVFRLTVHQICAGLSDAQGAPGRLQPVRCGQPFAVLVDYAHTDDALAKALQALRPLTKGRLRVVFGCGGDRDRTKRPLMARAAEQIADVIYVTSDNPRTENAIDIIGEIVAGFGRHHRKPVIIEADRRSAIGRAIEDASDGDVVLIAGKGHENYQIIGATRHHFDDVEEVTMALNREMKPQA
jgi:UDP-N-acetylmuramoyl-L-alanyl-D-glutamate--2,6-diaminopimelate ligase